ncbi:hypothetical protein FPSM_01298 [Flavobacterium psychrophilum]|nr:hypothetical protein FPSM_01298 [Flavobacterium psychrophilum]
MQSFFGEKPQKGFSLLSGLGHCGNKTTFSQNT